MESRKPSTRRRILENLRRRGPRTVGEIASEFRLSPMAIRLQMAALVREGLARSASTRPSRGRPAREYVLTRKAAACFPQRSGALALSLLEDVEASAGRAAVVKALESRARRTMEAYGADLRDRAPEERIRALARLRDREGYLCEVEERDGALPDLVERHCPVAEVAERWPEVCRLEAEVFGRVLGLPVKREEHLLSGGSCCRYRVGREV